jgi:hypothetical protein
MKHLFPSADGAVLIFSSNDQDSINCIDKLKSEIEKSKDKKEICHFICIDYAPNCSSNSNETTTSNNREAIRQDVQSKLRASVYEITSLDKRDLLCKPFVDLGILMTQVITKNIVPSIRKPKSLFSSNK